MKTEEIKVGNSYRSNAGIVAHVDDRAGDRIHWTVGKSSSWMDVSKFAKWAKEEVPQ